MPSIPGITMSVNSTLMRSSARRRESGVDLLTIQAWLGHSQVATTHRYAAADVEIMRRGLDKAGVSGKLPARFQPKDTVLQLLESI